MRKATLRSLMIGNWMKNLKGGAAEHDDSELSEGAGQELQNREEDNENDIYVLSG